MRNQFGERLFSIFFKTYTEKVWGWAAMKFSPIGRRSASKGCASAHQIDDSPILDVTRAALGSFCTREDAPAAIIFPLEKNKPLPAGLDAAIWTPPHSRYIADANDKMICM